MVLQSGLFVVEAFPGHCDCLALANILAKAMGMNSADNQVRLAPHFTSRCMFLTHLRGSHAAPTGRTMV